MKHTVFIFFKNNLAIVNKNQSTYSLFVQVLWPLCKAFNFDWSLIYAFETNKQNDKFFKQYANTPKKHCSKIVLFALTDKNFCLKKFCILKPKYSS